MKTDIQHVILRGLDQQIPHFRELRRSVVRPARGWLRAVREAIGLPQNTPAMRLGVKRQTWSHLEESEGRESITVASLRRAAGALDCDLVYFLVPRESVAATFDDLAKHHDPEARHLTATEHSMALEGQGAGEPVAHRRTPPGPR